MLWEHKGGLALGTKATYLELLPHDQAVLMPVAREVSAPFGSGATAQPGPMLVAAFTGLGSGRALCWPQQLIGSWNRAPL